jgi:nitrogen fixation NifU-like protein
MPENDPCLKEKLRAFYSETTIDHIVRPRNVEGIPNPDGFAACRSGCGETMKISLNVRNNVVADAAFWTDGCAATVACGSMATDLVKGKAVSQGLALTARSIAEALVDLPEGNFHCAELAAHTLSVALRDYLSTTQQPWKRLYRK